MQSYFRIPVMYVQTGMLYLLVRPTLVWLNYYLLLLVSCYLSWPFPFWLFQSVVTPWQVGTIEFIYTSILPPPLPLYHHAPPSPSNSLPHHHSLLPLLPLPLPYLSFSAFSSSSTLPLYHHTPPSPYNSPNPPLLPILQPPPTILPLPLSSFSFLLFSSSPLLPHPPLLPLRPFHP